MIRAFARFWAKLSYVFGQEVEAARTDLNAALADKRAHDNARLAEQSRKEADEIEQNIAREEATPEYQALAGQEKYEADREKNDAKKIVAEKRQAAEKYGEDAKGGREAAAHFRKLAQNGRNVADRIRSL